LTLAYRGQHHTVNNRVIVTNSVAGCYDESSSIPASSILQTHRSDMCNSFCLVNGRNRRKTLMKTLLTSGATILQCILNGISTKVSFTTFY